MIDYVDFQHLAQQCAPAVHYKTMAHLVQQESSFNPFAIGVVGGRLKRQPTNLSEAVATAKALIARKINFSAGLTQVNWKNFDAYQLDVVSVFDACRNLEVGSNIFVECYNRADTNKREGPQQSIRYGFSCFYSGNFKTGFKEGYVQSIQGRVNKGSLAR